MWISECEVCSNLSEFRGMFNIAYHLRTKSAFQSIYILYSTFLKSFPYLMKLFKFEAVRLNSDNIHRWHIFAASKVTKKLHITFNLFNVKFDGPMATGHLYRKFKTTNMKIWKWGSIVWFVYFIFTIKQKHLSVSKISLFH